MTATIHPAAPSAAEPAKTKPKPDPRYIALRNFAMSISAFNIFGYTLLGFEQPWIWPIFAVLIGYTAEIVFELISSWAYKRPPRFTGLGLSGRPTVTIVPSTASSLMKASTSRFAASSPTPM